MKFLITLMAVALVAGVTFAIPLEVEDRASGYSKVKSGKECNSGDEKLGTFSSVGQCADACRAKGTCNYFIYGTGSKSGSCWWEYTSTASCSEGWQDDSYNFYEITVRTDYSCKTNEWDSPQYCLCQPGYQLKNMASVHDNGREDRRYTLGCGKISPDFVGTDTSSYPSHTSQSDWDAALNFVFSDGFIVGMASYHDNGREDRRFTFFYTKIDSTYWELNNCKWNKMNNWDDPMDYKLTGDQVFAGIKSTHDNGREDREWHAYVCDLFAKPIHCEWNDWVLGTCSKECGTGSQTNTRTKKVVEINGGTCSGQPSEDVECKIKECPVHCEWGAWVVPDCDKSCGGGTHTDTRTVSTAAQHGGTECTGESSLTISCNVQECPVHGGWGEWSVWEDCPVSCAGADQGRTRVCDTPAPQFGGNDCTVDGSTNSESQRCNENPCPINGGWGDWTDWVACAVSCGGADQGRTRVCDKPAPQFGGTDCTVDGSTASDTQRCNENPCPINGGFSAWDEWGPCTASCGGGDQTRARRCDNPAPQFGGLDCEGDLTGCQRCSVDLCPSTCPAN